jgi:diketogulonate reductase-like aldo/keto reductase
MDAFRLPSGKPASRLGQGAWQIGEDRRKRADIAEVVANEREHVFLVSKVLPENASRRGTVAACERSLKRLKTDYLDLYLLHWRGSVPLDETLEAFTTLKARGAIRHYGVSNFDVRDLDEAQALPGGSGIATNQVLYNLEHRGIEWNLLPWCRQQQIPLMAYSPLGSDSRRLRAHPVLKAMAARIGATPARIALAWLLRQPDVVVIPKAGSEAHVRDNHAALTLALSAADLEEIDRSFPPPKGPRPLAMI